jgi:hypothetical protein
MMFDGAPQAGYADSLVAYTMGGVLTTCGGATLAEPCDGTPSTGTCEPNPALGMPDGAGFALDEGGTIEVAFRCGWAMRHLSPGGEILPDLRVVSMGDFPDPDAGLMVPAIVEVSYDGSSFVELGPIVSANQTFSLTRIELEVIRFVRIADSSGPGQITVDAVEAL